MRRMLLTLLISVSTSLWAAEPRVLTWAEMIPPDAPVVKPVTTPMHDLSKMSDALAMEQAPAASQLAPHAPVVKALDGKQVRLPGYIVPLEVSEEGRVIEFLLVPYFGACIHVPPPPANQIVHVTSELGVKVDELYQPYWIEGPMQTKSSSSELAEAGYQMQADKIFVYELPDT
ncbi:DUF3299 domain-containing protein [Pseudomonas viridiflava]|uniref:DUF3299 domain-containing protein n=1 Tax=Pseudomonas viridiflava TaxID=33069 RepID=UPI002A6A3026|nr:DUF3299 domain-containing protein [Pseudomonas viridiflava]MDY0936648.1 DUF3299 domain-containing protein [Pseudomonas viridiflava]MDY1012050.1 DUF3299 domain-containing protein [Pseudomonas viridiflava]